MALQWFAARAKAGLEFRAAISVTGLGYMVFLPTQMVQRRHAGKVEQVMRPLFPRYLFARFDQFVGGYGRINNCRGIANRGLLVSAEGKPLHIPDKIIEKIRDREKLMLAKAGDLNTGYRPGETFVIQVGPFASFLARYLGEEKGKVWALVDLFGRENRLELDFNEVPSHPRALDNFAA